LILNHFGDSVSGPEKAGVGGSIPSLATNIFNGLASLKNRVKISRAHNTRTSIALDFTFGVARSNDCPHLSHHPAGLAICCTGFALKKGESIAKT